MLQVWPLPQPSPVRTGRFRPPHEGFPARCTGRSLNTGLQSYLVTSAWSGPRTCKPSQTHTHTTQAAPMLPPTCKPSQTHTHTTQAAPMSLLLIILLPFMHHRLHDARTSFRAGSYAAAPDQPLPSKRVLAGKGEGAGCLAHNAHMLTGSYAAAPHHNPASSSRAGPSVSMLPLAAYTPDHHPAPPALPASPALRMIRTMLVPWWITLTAWRIGTWACSRSPRCQARRS